MKVITNQDWADFDAEFGEDDEIGHALDRVICEEGFGDEL